MKKENLNQASLQFHTGGAVRVEKNPIADGLPPITAKKAKELSDIFYSKAYSDKYQEKDGFWKADFMKLRRREQEQVRTMFGCLGSLSGVGIEKGLECNWSIIASKPPKDVKPLLALWLQYDRRFTNEILKDLSCLEDLAILTYMRYVMHFLWLNKSCTMLADTCSELPFLMLQATTLTDKKAAEQFKDLAGHMSAAELDFLMDRWHKGVSTRTELYEVSRERLRLASRLSAAERDKATSESTFRLAQQRLEEENQLLRDRLATCDNRAGEIERQNAEQVKALKQENEGLRGQIELLSAELTQARVLKDLVEEKEHPETLGEDIDLSQFSVLCIGGHENFLKKLRQRFPLWDVPGTQVSSNGSKSYDLVLYYVDHCSHSQYHIGRQIASAAGAIELYIGRSINLDMVERNVKRNLALLLEAPTERGEE